MKIQNKLFNLLIKGSYSWFTMTIIYIYCKPKKSKFSPTYFPINVRSVLAQDLFYTERFRDFIDYKAIICTINNSCQFNIDNKFDYLNNILKSKMNMKNKY